MQLTNRAIVLAAALLASTPLLAASFGNSTTDSDVPAQVSQTTTQPEDCTLPSLSPADHASGLAGLLPKPGSSPSDTADVDRRLSKAASCVRPLGIWNDEPEDSISPKRAFSFTTMPAGASTAWPLQRSF
jgi:hypothetical protein